MSEPKARANLPLLSFSQSEDLKVLSDLIGELSDTLEANRLATDELCAKADQLQFGNNEEDEDEDDGTSTDTEESSQLALENESLRKQITAYRQKHDANIAFIRVCMFSFEHCLRQLRSYVHEKTMETLDIHRHYILRIEEEQNKFIQLVQDRSELENGIFQLSRHLGQVVRKASDVSVTKGSGPDWATNLDYKQGLRDIMVEIQQQEKEVSRLTLR